MVEYRDDELALVLRGERYFLHGTFDGRRIRKACGTSNFERAKLFLENTKRELTHGWREDYDQSNVEWKQIAEKIHERHRRGAEKRGIPFDINPGSIYGMLRSTGFRCAVSGIPLAKRLISDGKRDPWAPSLDRIENRQGYFVENVRVVCLAANIAMSDWGLDVLIRLTRGVQRSSLLMSLEELPSSEHNCTKKDDKPLMRIVNLT